MKTRVSVMLWRKTHKTNSKGLAPISCRVTVAGKRAEITTQVRVPLDEWSDARKKVLGSTAAARTANAALTKIADELIDLAADIERQGKPVTAQSLARAYRAGGNTLNMLGLYEAYLAERHSLVGVELAPGTIKQNTTACNRLSDFLKLQKLTDLRPEEFTHNTADKMTHWLLITLGHKRASVNKVLRAISQMLRWAVRREYLEKNPLNLYQYKRQAASDILVSYRGRASYLDAPRLVCGSIA